MKALFTTRGLHLLDHGVPAECDLAAGVHFYGVGTSGHGRGYAAVCDRVVGHSYVGTARDEYSAVVSAVDGIVIKHDVIKNTRILWGGDTIHLCPAAQNTVIRVNQPDVLELAVLHGDIAWRNRLVKEVNLVKYPNSAHCAVLETAVFHQCVVVLNQHSSRTVVLYRHPSYSGLATPADVT